MDSLREVDAGDLSVLVSESAEHPLVVEFFGDRCPACRVVATLLDELARQPELPVRIVKVNVDRHPEVADRHAIRGVPALIYFEDAREQRRSTSALSRASIRAFVTGAQP